MDRKISSTRRRSLDVVQGSVGIAWRPRAIVSSTCAVLFVYVRIVQLLQKPTVIEGRAE